MEKADLVTLTFGLQSLTTLGTLMVLVGEMYQGEKSRTQDMVKTIWPNQYFTFPKDDNRRSTEHDWTC